MTDCNHNVGYMVTEGVARVWATFSLMVTAGNSLIWV